MIGEIIILIVCVEAHSPVIKVGEKVYVVVSALFIAGDHVPVIPFVELVGSGDIVAPEQNGPTCIKFGRMDWVIAILIVCVVAQIPVVGVKV
jgi:hypothetical protein